MRGDDAAAPRAARAAARRRVEHRDGPRPRAGVAQRRARSAPTPARCRPGRRARPRADSLERADRRQPHDPRALARGDLDRGGVQPADRVVERDRADRSARTPGPRR